MDSLSLALVFHVIHIHMHRMSSSAAQYIYMCKNTDTLVRIAEVTFVCDLQKKKIERKNKKNNHLMGKYGDARTFSI